MSKRTLAICLVFAACTAVTALFWWAAKSRIVSLPGNAVELDETSKQASLTERRAHFLEKEKWIVGTWRSRKLDYQDFGEWEGAVQIELSGSSRDEMELFLIFADGKRSPAGDGYLSIMEESRLIFGPVGSALIFNYRHSGNDLILDLHASGVIIHAELSRVEK